MFIVTGGAGFIGSNLVKALNDRGESDIVVVDDLTDGHKFANIAAARIADYLDRDDFRDRIRAGESFGRIAAVFHQGACTDTTEWDGGFMLDANFETSKEIFRWCQAQAVPLIYASSAAVYGAAARFNENDEDLRPLNVYGWSKLLFDRWVARHRGDLTARAVGFRYFNVYGPGEAHKARMASVVHHFDRQVRESKVIRLFGASHGCGDGEHRRDFIFVGDVAKANLWAFESDAANGVYNLGTGESRSFNDVARAVIDWHGRGTIEYMSMPEDLEVAYQAFTEADIGRLRDAGYAGDFVSLEDGVRRTLDARAQPAG
ncbi:MAG: ADP-glyceromanno-heptose 6-epimerase [Bauldia sp.]|nr:ADP-glyceromanno-heptose 6-epimerase [Bauldia sp.]